MATIVLSALGTLIGGPLGGAIGALLGREVDDRVFGPRHEGPRLKDLKVSGSSYGDPIARHYGAIRTAGTIVWATDLKESSEKTGGGKGQPKGTTYSYSISFAVLLASAPIDRVGRIWADGNLLRGAGGDLKTGGTLRLYRGLDDQAADPLLAAKLGAQCPAMRGSAYAVFEDLALADFGNRIPAISFEIFAGEGSAALADLAAQAEATASPGLAFPELEGFTHEGGAIGDILALIDRIHPLVPVGGVSQLALASGGVSSAAPIALGEPASWLEGDFGRTAGSARARSASLDHSGPAALRYYDPARDYQPGLQRPAGPVPNGATATLEFPGVLAAGDARRLVDRARSRAAARRDTLSLRTAMLDPSVVPGALVTVPGSNAVWQVKSWEWRAGGIELELLRHVGWQASQAPADAGSGWSAPDRLPQPTLLRAFGLPWDGYGSETARQAYVAASAAAGRWSGATLYTVADSVLKPFGEAPAQRAVIGSLTAALAPSNALRFEPAASVDIMLADSGAELAPATLAQLATGANRARVGEEILQFASAAPLGDGAWRLTGLLRGRGGTEAIAQGGHAAGKDFVLLDDRLLALDEAVIDAAQKEGLAAIGFGDADPVLAPLNDALASLRPLTPVHARLVVASDGSRKLSWARRARGGWTWLDETDQPLAEDSESYELAIGSVGAPSLRWVLSSPAHQFTASEWTAIVAAHAGKKLWVRQRGRAATSYPLLIATIA